MKFLPTLRPLALLGLAISLAACSTAANRRELYNTLGANGPWQDYSRRLDASAETGVAPGDMGKAAPGSDVAPGGIPGNNTTGTTVVRGRPTRAPKSSPLTPDPVTSPSTPAAPAPAGVPVPAGVPGSPTDPMAPSPAAPAPVTPGGDTPPAPVNAPTT